MTRLDRDRGLERLVELSRDALPGEMSPREQAGLARLEAAVFPLRASNAGWKWGLAALAADPVATQVEGDAVEPGREFRLPLEATKRAERAKEGLLTHVARVFFPANHPVGEGVDRPLPTQHELVETVQISANGAGDQFLVCRRHPEGAHFLLN